MNKTKNKTMTTQKGKAFFTDVPLDRLWINLMAQNIGINTLFTEPTEEMEEITFYDLIDSIGGTSIAHPVLAKVFMFQHLSRSYPKVYKNVVDNGISKETIYLFKDWTWEPNSPRASWFNMLKGKTHEFPLQKWSKLHDMVMTRCLTTNVRDLFYHFQKMSQYGIFLTGLYEAGNIPLELLRNDQ